MALETRVYQKERTIKFGALLKASLGDMLRSRFLARQLAERDIKAQYRQSYLGIIWAFVMPIGTALVWIFLNNSGTVRLSDTGVPYPVYAFSGTLIWSIMVAAINSPMQNTNAAKGILTKINFPKEALLLSGVYKLLFDSFIKLLLLVFFVFAFGVGFHWSLLLVPFAILAAVLFGTTVGLFLTPLGLLYKDIGKIITFGMQFLMYATPVVYAIPDAGLMRTVMMYNPITPIILTTRDLVVGFSPEFLSYFIVVIAACVPLLFLGLVMYRIAIPIIVERLSA
ncbi:ABC transporter permease [Meridianimaribacter flavus]|uniref:Lipopolysaccharide transport system permease protein n=1 Tax=Meridianimaribacter flavus TaxID=571115 RepID=A0ABY2G715_9FLAO|nr:ABC transporter permease [Meridianimaribacter flavus]TDY11765.1 lipopolysaccharide transport system permease protein [Meridianimaribacter flavus]